MKNVTKFIPILFALLLLIVGCAGSGDKDTATHVSGKVIQSYVANATVCMDSNENRICDSGEVSTKADENGYFSLPIPDDVSGMLLSQGGVVKSTGQPALNLLAPVGAKNITPLTTLVALNPNLKSKIEDLGGPYDTDIADPNGVNAKLLGIALSVETVLYNLKNQLQLDPEKQMVLMTSVAKELGDTTLDSDTNIINAFKKGIKEALDINATISAITSSIQNILDNIGEGTVKEKEVLSTLKDIVYVNVFPVLDPIKEILPVPNDIIWANTNGKVMLPTNSTDPAQNALYSAINQLGIKGLSCNSPIAIPLSSTTPLDEESLKNNIYLINTTTLAGAIYMALSQMGMQPSGTDLPSILSSLSQLTPDDLQKLISNLDLENVDMDKIKIVQEGNYLKIFPLKPLDPGVQYLVVLKSGIKLESGTNLTSSMLFDLLKSSSEITTEDLKNLEPLRKAYSPLFALLNAYGINKNDILELFTFTTADKTLSLQDFGLIAADLNRTHSKYFIIASDLPISGLKLSNATSEYYQINSAIGLLKGLASVNSSAFTSFDITTLTNNPPTSISVPYIVVNGNLYSDSVLVFQHGLGGKKEAAQILAQKITNIPIIAMDLPKHGERSTDPANSGADYLTGNIGQDRINLYQSYFDIGMFLNLIKDGKFDIDGDGNPDLPTNIYFVGQSMGSITGSVATSLNSNIVDKVVLNVGGANFAALVDQASNKLIQGLLNSMGLTKNNTEYFITLGILQLLLDPSDPVYLAKNTIHDKVMVQTSYHDTVVSNISNKLLAYTLGFDRPNTVTPSSSDPTNYSNWFMFKGDGDKNWITHGILLGVHPEYYPEAADYLDNSNLEWAYDKINDFIFNYLQ
ncbi:alpha/beta hydrolase family protein [Desulfothermus sp.]